MILVKLKRLDRVDVRAHKLSLQRFKHVVLRCAHDNDIASRTLTSPTPASVTHAAARADASCYALTCALTLLRAAVSGLTLLLNKAACCQGMPKRAREEPCAICGHWHDYEGGEPCSVCGHTFAKNDESHNKNSAFPTEILPGFLYLGSYDNASRSELLKTVGITHILNTVPTCQNLYKNSFRYHTVSTKPPDFQECFSYLDSVQQERGRVLVHCMTGTSASPSVVIGYLVWVRKWRLSESYKWVHDRRACVSLQEGEANRLQQLEIQLLGDSSTGFNTNGTPHQPSGPFDWSAWRDAPQPSPPALGASEPFSSFGQPQHASPNNFVFGNTNPS